MTYEEYTEQKQEAFEEVCKANKRMHDLRDAYIAQHIALEEGTDVIFEGKKYTFVGSCDINTKGELLYAIRRWDGTLKLSGKIGLQRLENLEVVK